MTDPSAARPAPPGRKVTLRELIEIISDKAQHASIGDPITEVCFALTMIEQRLTELEAK